MSKIVIVEDQEFIREELNYILKKSNYDTHTIEDFEDVYEQILEQSPNLVLLDINIPNENGFEICKKIKNQIDIPILILTSRDGIKDEINAFNLGADDFINKPYNKDRLLARIENLLRRFRSINNFVILKTIKLDKNTYTLYTVDKSIVLSENQGKMLKLFMENIDKVVTKDMLSYSIWNTNEFIDENALQVNMTRLKKTIKTINIDYEIETIRGKGYIFKEIK